MNIYQYPTRIEPAGQPPSNLPKGTIFRVEGQADIFMTVRWRSGHGAGTAVESYRRIVNLETGDYYEPPTDMRAIPLTAGELVAFKANMPA